MIKSHLNVGGATLSLQGDANTNIVEIHGLSVDEDRTHYVFSNQSLVKIGEWLIAFAGEQPKESVDKSDPRTWEIIVIGPES